MIKIVRVLHSDNGTFGVFLDGDTPLCLTCEDPWKDNHPMVSCIPEGKYKFTKYSSPRFNDVWILENVPGRSMILIHSGNTIDDTHGCILVGERFGSLGTLPAVLQSKEALQMLRSKLPDEGDIEIVGL